MIEWSRHWPVMICFIFTQQTESPSLSMPSIIYALVLKFHSERRYRKLEGLFLIHVCPPFFFSLSLWEQSQTNSVHIPRKPALPSLPASVVLFQLAPAFCKFVPIILWFPYIYTFESRQDWEARSKDATFRLVQFLSLHTDWTRVIGRLGCSGTEHVLVTISWWDSGPSSSLDWSHWVVLLGQTLYSLIRVRRNYL